MKKNILLILYSKSQALVNFLSCSLPEVRGGLGWGKNFTTHLGWLYLIPVLLLIGFVANFSVNVPVDDEWRLASFFEKIAAGNVTFNDFWALHSNHRIVFPKIIIATLAFASQWNINYLLCSSIGLAAITFIVLYKLACQTVKNSSNLFADLANILTCFLIFSLAQHENWLWGFQLAWFLVNLCFVVAIYALTSQRKLLSFLAFSNYRKNRKEAALSRPYSIEEATTEDSKIPNAYSIEDAAAEDNKIPNAYSIEDVAEANMKLPEAYSIEDAAAENTKLPTNYPLEDAAAADKQIPHPHRIETAKEEVTASDTYPIYMRIVIAAICCFIASFSLAQGLLSWLAAIPAVVALEGNARQKRKRAIVWIMLFLATCAVYFINYQPSRKTSIMGLLHKPLAVIDYFLSLLGSPIVRSPGFSAFAGLVILGIFGYFAVYFTSAIVRSQSQSLDDASSSLAMTKDENYSDNVIASYLAMTTREGAQDNAIASYLAMIKRKELPDNSIASSLAMTEGKDCAMREGNADIAVPWLSIGLFAILSSLFITVGRAEFGAIQAIESSRYTTNSILLLIASIQLGQLFVTEKRAALKRNLKFIYWGFSGLLIAAIIVNSQQAVAQARSAFIYKQGARDCLQLINYLEQSEFFNNSPESCLRVLSKKTWLVREGAASIDRLAWRNFAKKVEFVAKSDRVYGYLDKPERGDISLSVKKNAAVKAAGWAILPENLPQPNIVLLSVGDKPSFFANAYINLDSPDIAQTFKSKSYNNARWAVNLPANDLSIDPTEIKAWVYNPGDNQFVKLRGGARVTVEE